MTELREVTFEFTAKGEHHGANIVVTENPEWGIERSTVTVDGTEPDEWDHSLNRLDTWLIDSTILDGAVVRTTVTYQLPDDVSPGTYDFEARADLGGGSRGWQKSLAAVTVSPDAPPDDDRFRFEAGDLVIEGTIDYIEGV